MLIENQYLTFIPPAPPNSGKAGLEGYLSEIAHKTVNWWTTVDDCGQE